jgi:hypothetical protein
VLNRFLTSWSLSVHSTRLLPVMMPMCVMKSEPEELPRSFTQAFCMLVTSSLNACAEGHACYLSERLASLRLCAVLSMCFDGSVK